MYNSMPWTLLISWSFFFGFVNSHQRHLEHIQSATKNHQLLFQISAILGSIIGSFLFCYYFVNTPWYWSAILLMVGYLLAGIMFSIFDHIIGELGVNIISFVGWPVFAEWTYLIINGMEKT
jgi:predicted MFS family arabinose efflux permease